MNVLVIEDDVAVRQTLEDLLELNGHTVFSAADGVEGVKLAERIPDLIICDIGMPGMDGYQVIASIQQMPLCRDIPFIFLTARTGRDDLRRGMSLGADDYITKPFSERDVLEAIKARFRRQQPLREKVDRLLATRTEQAGADWSHTLMTPLNGILGGLQLIEAEADTIGPSELKELLSLIRSSAERQQTLSRKIILYFELERIKDAPPLGSGCDAPTVIAASAFRMAEAQKRAADLTVRCEPGSVSISPGYLAAAVGELVENACDFSRPGQPVLVTGTRSGERYLIEVIDEGPGMTADQRGQAIAFAQFDKGRHNQQGIGLGLAIARAAVALAGGRLLLDDARPGQPGLKARLDLPCRS